MALHQPAVWFLTLCRAHSLRSSLLTLAIGRDFFHYVDSGQMRLTPFCPRLGTLSTVRDDLRRDRSWKSSRSSRTT